MSAIYFIPEHQDEHCGDICQVPAVLCVYPRRDGARLQEIEEI